MKLILVTYMIHIHVGGRMVPLYGRIFSLLPREDRGIQLSLPLLEEEYLLLELPLSTMRCIHCITQRLAS
jgi:hypothetical protein